MLMLSMVLLTVNGVVAWLAYADLIEKFEERRTLVRERHLTEALSMQRDAAQEMQRLADMMASFAGMAGFTGSREGTPGFQRTFDTYWSSLQFNQGLDALRFYDLRGRMIPQLSSSQEASGREFAEVEHVLKHEKSSSWLDCAQECLHSAAAPILSEGRVAGAVVVTGLLADMIVLYRQLTGLDIGLLTAIPATDSRTLPALGMRVAGLSGADRNFPLLARLSGLPPERGGKSWARVRQGERDFDIAFARVNPADGRASPMIVVLEDVSAEYVRIRSQAWWQLSGNVVTSLLALALLVFLLNAPLDRMRLAAEAIPLLGRGDFSGVRNRIRPRSGLAIRDEIDALDQAAIALSYRLEGLEREVHDTLERVSVERDFNQSLLDTAQVVIMTQGRSGEVMTINQYGEALTGWSEEELRGARSFDAIFHADSRESGMTRILHDIVEGRHDHLSQECVLVSRDGKERQIAWRHSLLAGGHGQVLSVGVDITERKRAEAHMLWLAEHDQLTGLANRQFFQRELEQAVAMARRTGRTGALLYLDLDGFKYVNDISGHQAGDVVLCMVAEALAALVRDVDLLARLGGDELGVLLHECNVDGAVAVAEKINQHLDGMVFPGLGARHGISASIGVVMFPTDSMDVRQMLANADIAMYQAKAKGRGCWHVYAEGERMQEKLQHLVLWEEKIKQGLEEGAFFMHYQPILDIHSNTISHYEALVRMRNDDGSITMPGEFMEVAEKSGLIRLVDRYVVRAVIDRLLALLSAGRNYKIAVNLSGVSINDDSLLDFLREELQRSSDLPTHLIFEITETAAVSDFSSARNFMQAVRELGCVFSLDDFGVGFSSFNYVKHLPVDYIKIDGSFIRALADSPDDQVFVRALTEVARGFGKKTVAEFVENERILVLLRMIGVDYAQGYFIGKPGEAIGGN